MALEDAAAVVETGGMDFESTAADIASDLGYDDDAGEGKESEGAAEADGSQPSTTNAPAPGKEPAAAESKPGASTGEPADPNDRVPDTWRAEAKTTWGTIPAPARAEILKREGDIAKFVQDTKPGIEMGQAVEKMLAPLGPHFQQRGLNPWEMMPQILNAYAVMAWGKAEDRETMFKALAKDMNFDLTKLGEGQPQPAEDPRLAQMAQRIAQLEGGVSRVTSHFSGQQRSQLEAQVKAFADDPKNVHFETVAADMAQLLDKGVSKTIDEAYERAVWANPVTRAKLQAAEAETNAKKAADAAKERATQAKKARGVNVTSRNSGGTRAGAADGKWEDDLSGTLAEINARH